MRETLTRIEAGIFDLLTSPSRESYMLGLELLSKRKSYTRNHIVTALITYLCHKTTVNEGKLANEYTYCAGVGCFDVSIVVNIYDNAANVHISLYGQDKSTCYLEMVNVPIHPSRTKLVYGKMYAMLSTHIGTWKLAVNTRYHGDNVWRIWHKIMRYERY